jgi:hypothetical protein
MAEGPPEPFPAVDLAGLHTRPFHARRARVHAADLGRPLDPPPDVDRLLRGLPRLLAAEDLRAVVGAWAAAVRGEAGVLVMSGGHVVKAGCGPFLADLVRRGAVSHLALNGAAAIHDAELALFGATSEDVAENLADGSFGAADETGRAFARALGGAAGRGAGEALGKLLEDEAAPHRDTSLLAACWRARVPVTVHAAIGAEITHQHPACDGAAVGETSHRDFRVLAHSVGRIREGGVVLNLGSAVVLPEVFLKALSVARNLGRPARGFTAVDVDMLRQYRPAANVVGRPVLAGGRGIHLTGHHEILIPILYYAVRAALEGEA